MARPRTFTDAEFTRAYRETNNTGELAARMGISTVSAYKYLRTLNLESKNPPGRPDLRAFSDEELLEAYNSSGSSVAMMAIRLQTSPHTVRKHIKRLTKSGHIDPSNDQPSTMGMTLEQCEKVFNDYRATVTMRDIATAHKISTSSVRRAFDRVMMNRWAIPQPTPPPMSYGHIKLHHMLTSDPAAINQPTSKIAEATNLPVNQVERYIKACHVLIANSKQKRKK